MRTFIVPLIVAQAVIVALPPAVRSVVLRPPTTVRAFVTSMTAPTGPPIVSISGILTEGDDYILTEIGDFLVLEG